MNPARQLRKAHGMGLRETARLTGLDPTQLSRIERGLSTPSLPTLLKLAQLFGLSELERVLQPWVRP